MSLNKIQQLASSLVTSLDDNEKLSIHRLASKLARCLENDPHDQTVGAMSRVIGKMADNNTAFIRRADFKTLYHKLHSRGTGFASLFADELGGTQELPAAKVAVRDSGKEIEPYQVQDAVLANALGRAFDNTIAVKSYSQSMANKAMAAVNQTLDAWNLAPNALRVESGNESFLVIRAEYETPKGLTGFFVPVAVNKDQVLEPSLFMGNAGVEELNHTAIKSYLTSHTGNALKISGTAILGALMTANEGDRQISDAEIALTKLNASRQERGDFLDGQITGQKIAEASVKDVELPKSDEFASFEKAFNSPYGIASFQFGEDKVKTARDHIVRELIGFGHKNPQVIVNGSNDQSISFGVSLDGGKVAFTVPVKVNAGKIVAPSVMICNGSVSSFGKESINELYVANQSDYKVAAAASPLFGLKPSDLINNVRQAMADENHAKAEDALNVLANCGDEKAYAAGFQVFLQGLSGKKAEVSKCSMPIQTTASQHMVCGHTGLPVHKVYQDKQGNCRPLHRRGMDETYQGASFMNAKIFG